MNLLTIPSRASDAGPCRPKGTIECPNCEAHFSIPRELRFCDHTGCTVPLCYDCQEESRCASCYKLRCKSHLLPVLNGDVKERICWGCMELL